MNKELLDKQGVTGQLAIYVNPNGTDAMIPIFKGGDDDEDDSEPNVVTTAAKAHLLSLIYDTTLTAAPDPIVRFQVGNGGTLDGSPGNPGTPGVNPKPSDGSETILNAEISDSGGTEYFPTEITHDAVGISSGTTQVTYSFGITPNQLNGRYISEVGLFTQSGMMFNIKTFASIPKTSAFSLHFVWTIQHV